MKAILTEGIDYAIHWTNTHSVYCWTGCTKFYGVFFHPDASVHCIEKSWGGLQKA